MSWIRRYCMRNAELSHDQPMVARGRFELPSMGLFLVRESKAHHWPGHCFRPLLVHYTTGLQETRVFGQVPISLPRDRAQSRLGGSWLCSLELVEEPKPFY